MTRASLTQPLPTTETTEPDSVAQPVPAIAADLSADAAATAEAAAVAAELEDNRAYAWHWGINE